MSHYHFVSSDWFKLDESYLKTETEDYLFDVLQGVQSLFCVSQYLTYRNLGLFKVFVFSPAYEKFQFSITASMKQKSQPLLDIKKIIQYIWYHIIWQENNTKSNTNMQMPALPWYLELLAKPNEMYYTRST